MLNRKFSSDPIGVRIVGSKNARDSQPTYQTVWESSKTDGTLHVKEALLNLWNVWPTVQVQLKYATDRGGHVWIHELKKSC
jgi:hypothetical protein